MARVKKGVNAHKRHKKILKLAKGFYGAKSKQFRAANPAVMRALRSAYVGRKLKKRQYRQMWIARINAGARMNGLSYSRLMDGLKKSGIDISDRRVIGAALVRAESTGAPAVALELPDGQIVTGKTTPLLGPASAALLNALKVLAGIAHDIPLISPNVIEPISDLKINHLGNHNPRLHTDEVLIALAISAATNPVAELAMQQIGNLMNSDAHSTTMMSSVDINMFHKLGINLTCEPVYETKKLYHR